MYLLTQNAPYSCASPCRRRHEVSPLGLIAYFTPGIKPINGIIAAALIYWFLGSVWNGRSSEETSER